MPVCFPLSTGENTFSEPQKSPLSIENIIEISKLVPFGTTWRQRNFGTQKPGRQRIGSRIWQSIIRGSFLTRRACFRLVVGSVKVRPTLTDRNQSWQR
jgi:hypothetical protein